MILVEAAQDARTLAPTPSRDEPVLAVTPEAAHELTRLGIAHSTDADLVSDAVFQDVTARTLATAERLAADLDRIVPAPGGEPVWGRAVLELKRMLDKYLGTAALLQAAASHLDAKEIAYFAGPSPAPSPSMELGPGSMWGPVVAPVAGALGIDARVLGTRESSPYGLQADRPWQRSSGLPRRLAAALRARRRFARLAGASPRGDAGTLLAVTVASGVVADVLTEAATDGLRVVQWEGRGRPNALTGPPRLLAAANVPGEREEEAAAWSASVCARIDSPDSQAAITSAAAQEGVDLTEPVAERLRGFARDHLAEVSLAPKRASATLEELDARMVLHSGAEYWWHRAVVDAARSRGLPVVAVQHGGGQGFIDDRSALLRRENELRGTDLYVAWGPGVVDDFCAAADPPVPGFVREPATLRAVRDGRGGGRARSRRLLVVPTNMTGNRRRGPSTEPRDTDHYLLQRRVAEAAIAAGDWEVTIKSAPGGLAADPPVTDDPRVTITRAGTLTDHARDSAAIVVLWPFTVLLEALATDLPVLCVCDEQTVRLRPEALDLLRRRAEVVTDVGELGERLGAFLERVDDPPPLDDGFLARYGLGGTGRVGWLGEVTRAAGRSG